jgi:hypothetical protein
MHIIQAASAVYLLLIFTYAVVVFARTAANPHATEVEGTIGGFPAFLASVAIVICAVTTLVAVW